MKWQGVEPLAGDPVEASNVINAPKRKKGTKCNKNVILNVILKLLFTLSGVFSFPYVTSLIRIGHP